MLEYLLLILMAWFINMPLWLSILTTCVGAIGLIAKIVKICVKVELERDLD